MINRILRGIDTCSSVGAYLSALFLLATVAIIVLEIVLRALFSTSTLIADEYGGYFMVSIILFGLAYTLREEGHIKITLVVQMVSERVAFTLEMIAAAIAGVFTAFVLYHAVLMTYETYSLGMQADTIAETPLFIPMIPIPVGLALLLLQLIARTIRRLPSYRNR